MILFNADMDHTMIYSYKHDIGKEKRCVERYHGREVSFITEETYALLRQVKEIAAFVPTTTRTKEQYERIDLGIGACHYALVCNGGVLLVDGREDVSWYKKSLELTSDARETLAYGAWLLERDHTRCFEVRIIQGLFTFTKSEKPLACVERLKQQLDASKADVFSNGIKVYIVPKKLDKGTAVLRLKEKVKADHVIAVGDSAFDVPMLNAADTAIAPAELRGTAGLREGVAYMPGSRVFSEELLSYIYKNFRVFTKENRKKTDK